MKDLSLRSNVIKRMAYGKNVFIYEDHRYVLNIIFQAFKKNVLTEPVTLIYFDKHDDGKNPISDPNKIKDYRKVLPSEQEFWSFTEWEISPMDDDWIKTGMELGLIGDAILIGCHNPFNFGDFSNQYIDHMGIKHNIYNVGTIWSGLSFQGWLTDQAQTYKYSPIWDLIGLDEHENFHLSQEKKKTKFIVDFDLDCFTTNLEGFTIPFPKEIFYKLFETYNNYSNIKPADFLINLISESEFVTIARESDFCGGIQNNSIIFNNINEVIFENQL